MVRIDSDLPTLVDLLPKQATGQRKVLRAVEGVVGDCRNEPVYVTRRELLDAVEKRYGMDASFERITIVNNFIMNWILLPSTALITFRLPDCVFRVIWLPTKTHLLGPQC